MDYGNMISDSFTYVKDGVICKAKSWLLLIIATLILTLPLDGYILNIYRGKTPAPEVENWGKLFVDGILFLIIALIYSIPLIALEFLIVGVAFINTPMTMASDPSAFISGLVGAGILALLLFIVAIIVALIEPIGLIRFARTGNFVEAFNFSEIVATIRKIGWLSYILALIIVTIAIGIPLVILWIIMMGLMVALSLTGFILTILIVLIVLPVIAVFQARYYTRVYDAAENK
ncbi:MAG: DUF4013 domain-containing protein [Methanoregula sp.]|jgi:hypothetical protein